MISRHAKGARSFRYRTGRIGLTFVPQFQRVSLRKPSDSQVFTSYNGSRLTDRGILSKMLLTPTVLELYAKPLFDFQCASYVAPTGCCLRRGDEQLRLGGANGHFC